MHHTRRKMTRVHQSEEPYVVFEKKSLPIKPFRRHSERTKDAPYPQEDDPSSSECESHVVFEKREPTKQIIPLAQREDQGCTKPAGKSLVDPTSSLAGMSADFSGGQHLPGYLIPAVQANNALLLQATLYLQCHTYTLFNSTKIPS
ncbi:hypothetical protein CBL_12382 [Carabus blaptoides fortunei]